MIDTVTLHANTEKLREIVELGRPAGSGPIEVLVAGVKMLISQGVDFEATDEEGHTLLGALVSYSSAHFTSLTMEELTRAFIRGGANPLGVEECLKGTMHDGRVFYGMLETMGACATRGLHFVDADGGNAFHHLASAEDIGQFEDVLEDLNNRYSSMDYQIALDTLENQIEPADGDEKESPENQAYVLGALKWLREGRLSDGRLPGHLLWEQLDRKEDGYSAWLISKSMYELGVDLSQPDANGISIADLITEKVGAGVVEVEEETQVLWQEIESINLQRKLDANTPTKARANTKPGRL